MRDFSDGSFTTKFAENYFTPTVLAKAATEDELVSGAVAAALFLEEKTALPRPLSAENTNWKTNRSFLDTAQKSDRTAMCTC